MSQESGKLLYQIIVLDCLSQSGVEKNVVEGPEERCLCQETHKHHRVEVALYRGISYRRGEEHRR